MPGTPPESSGASASDLTVETLAIASKRATADEERWSAFGAGHRRAAGAAARGHCDSGAAAVIPRLGLLVVRGGAHSTELFACAWSGCR